MKAITFRGTESVALETVPDPKIEASTDVIVKNRLTAICGSDRRCCTALAESKIRLLCWLRYVRP